MLVRVFFSFCQKNTNQLFWRRYLAKRSFLSVSCESIYFLWVRRHKALRPTPPRRGDMSILRSKMVEKDEMNVSQDIFSKKAD